MHIQTGNVAFFEHRSCLFISSVSLVFLRLTVSTQHTHKYTSQVLTTKVALEQVRLFYVTCQPNAALKSLSIYIYIYVCVCVCVCVSSKITNAFDRSDRTYFKNVTIMQHL